MKLLSRENFLKFSSVIAVVFNFSTLFVISQSFAAVDYGKYMYTYTISTLIASFSTFKLELSITDADTEKLAFTEAIRTIAISAFFFIFCYLLIKTFDFLDINYFILFFPVLIVLNVIAQQVFIFLEKHILNGSLISIISILNFVFIFTLDHSVNNLFFASFMSYLLPITIVIVFLVKRIIILNIKIKDVLFEFRNKRRYILYAYPMGLISIATQSFNIFLINNLFGFSVLGTYSIINKIFSVPSSSIGAASAGLARFKFSAMSLSEERTEKIKDFFDESVKISFISFPFLLISIFVLQEHTMLFHKYGAILEISFALVLTSAVQYIINQLAVVLLAINNIMAYIKILLTLTVILFIPFLLSVFLSNFGFVSFLTIQSIGSLIYLYLLRQKLLSLPSI